jgi:polysaccharide export outer membrane protein
MKSRSSSPWNPVVCAFVLCLAGLAGWPGQVHGQQPARAPVTPGVPPLSSPTVSRSAGLLGSDVDADSRYRIGPGDVLNIQIYNRPQLSREAVRVDGRGNIQMPWIEDDIHVACRTETEVAEEITTRYRPLLRAPQVGVFIKEYQSQPVAVMGAVNQPGRFQLQRRIRLLELLTYAGGPGERAGRSVQIIHTTPKLACEQTPEPPLAAEQTSAAVTQPGNAPTQVLGPLPAQPGAASGTASIEDDVYLTLELKQVLHGQLEANPFIRPGDIVTLPEADQVYVVGSVLRPSALVLRGPLTVSQAIAMAGGLMPDAKNDRVRIVRQTAAGKTEIFVDLKAVEKQQAEDLALQANDIVNVHVSGPRSFLRTVLSAVVPAVGQLPVRVVN